MSVEKAAVRRDPFAVLGLPQAYEIDAAALEKTHRELSRALHPDRYVSAAPSERAAALSRAIEVNEAFRLVRDPVRRAEALFALHDVPVGEAHEPKASPDFLMAVLEQREELAEARAARDLPRVQKLAAAVATLAKNAESALADAFRASKSGSGGLATHVARLGELRFYKRFLDEASAIEDDLEGV